MSKKFHRRQAKPAAVQAYPVSDALGDVLSRALTAFDQADGPALQRTLSGPQAAVELARLPNLRMFLEGGVHVLKAFDDKDVHAGVRAVKKMRKALGLALAEGLPAIAYEVLAHRIAVSDLSYEQALKGLDDLVATIDRAEVSTGSPVFDRYLQRCAHETRYLAETGIQITVRGASGVFEHGHFVEDLPFGDPSWHPRLITTTVRFTDRLHQEYDLRWAERYEVDDAVTDDPRFEADVAELSRRSAEAAKRTLGIILPHLHAESFRALEVKERFAVVSKLFDLFDSITDPTAQIALSLEWLQKPEALAAPSECPTEVIEDAVKLFLASNLIYLADPESTRIPAVSLRPTLHTSLRTPALERWLTLFQTEPVDDAAVKRLIDTETVPALRAFAEELHPLASLTTRMKADESRPLDVLRTEAAELHERLREAETRGDLRAMSCLTLLAEAYATGAELVREDRAGGVNLIRAAAALADRLPQGDGEGNPFLEDAYAAGVFEVAHAPRLGEVVEILDADPEDEDPDEGDEATSVTFVNIPNEQRILPAKYASEMVLGTKQLVETDSPVEVFYRSCREGVTFIVFTAGDMDRIAAEETELILMTANQLVNLRSELIGLFQNPSVMQGGFIRRADGRGFERFSPEGLPCGWSGHPRYEPCDEAFWDDVEDAVPGNPHVHA